MSLKLMGRKRGMVQLFDDKGNIVPCTVITLEPNVVVRVNTKEQNGYDALQLGFEKIKPNRLTKPLQGHFGHNNVECRRFLKESTIEDVDNYSVGQEIGVEFFEDISFVDVIGTSKGKGFQGVIKRYGFAGGPATHGSHFHRRPGSSGMRSTPGRCLPGKKKPGRMGGVRRTVQSLEIVEVNKEKNFIIVKGAVPGCKGGLLYVQPAVKKPTKGK